MNPRNGRLRSLRERSRKLTIFIREFKEISKSDILVAGGNWESLGEMTRAWIPVPPEFVVVTDAFELFLDVRKTLKDSLELYGGKKNFQRFNSTGTSRP